MELQEIEVEIARDGKVVLTVRGVGGRTCLDVTRTLEERLGGILEERRMIGDVNNDTESHEALVIRLADRKWGDQ